MTLECALVLSLHRLYQLETPILFQIHEVNISLECALHDRFQTKMSPTISFSGMYRKPFIYRTAGCKLSLVIVAHRRLGRKPATLEIAYDMKIDFLLCNLYFPLNQKSIIGTARLQIT